MYFSIEGVIGVGKTTLARTLQPRFDANILLEVFEENPFLGNFYADRARYAFQTQMFFLLSRYYQQNRTVPSFVAEGKDLISDYTFEKDALFASINLRGDELDMYYRIHEALAEKMINPSLVVYLRASTETLMQRIMLRDRSYERNMEVGYIDELNRAYDGYYLSAQHRTPVLIVESDGRDFVHNTADVDWVEAEIRRELANVPVQQQLPLESAPAKLYNQS
ncbi:MAG TPA: deoxynucleoside kinase [Bellilinea sp.]|nr:deoxynucleoside kinase [Bellilinea sp.]